MEKARGLFGKANAFEMVQIDLTIPELEDGHKSKWEEMLNKILLNIVANVGLTGLVNSCAEIIAAVKQ